MVMARILLAADAGGVASCAVITCPADDLIGQVHRRMPVALEPARFDEWLAGTGSTEHLLECRECPVMSALAISAAVNRARNDGPRLIEALSSDGAAGMRPGSRRLLLVGVVKYLVKPAGAGSQMLRRPHSVTVAGGSGSRANGNDKSEVVGRLPE